jgi:hypothetical protein
LSATDALAGACLEALRAYLDDTVGQEFLILHADRERNAYVQFIADGDRLYGEVSGDRYLTRPLSDEQRQQRSLLGWTESPGSPNPAQEWRPPIQLESIAVITARTLVEVFGLSPEDRPEVEMASG